MNRFKKFTMFVSILVLISLPVLAQQVDVGEGEDQIGPFETSCRGLGVFANLDTNSIQFIDPATNTLSPRYLQGYLGRGGLLDVAITSDGRNAIVSSFGSSYLYLIDISGGFDAEPSVIGRQFTHFFAEDLAITPDDKYVLVTDGGLASSISVIEIANLRYVLRREVPGDAQAIAISPDGQTVIVADYLGHAVHTLLIDADGMLTNKNTYRIAPFLPVNVAISPDGETVIVVYAFASRGGAFSLYAPGELSYKGTFNLPAANGQSCVFSKDGTKAYYGTSDHERKGTMVHILDVTGPGEVSASGTSIQVRPTRGGGSFFGVDTIALDPTDTYLYYTNNTSFGVHPAVTVIDLRTNTVLKQLWTDGTTPVGIDFTCSPQEE